MLLKKIPQTQPRKNFETAAMKTFSVVFENIETIGCFVNLSQSIMRKVHEFGLKKSTNLMSYLPNVFMIKLHKILSLR